MSETTNMWKYTIIIVDSEHVKISTEIETTGGPSPGILTSSIKICNIDKEFGYSKFLIKILNTVISLMNVKISADCFSGGETIKNRRIKRVCFDPNGEITDFIIE